MSVPAGILTTIGLVIIGVNFAVTLGLRAAILDALLFMIVGSVLAIVPGITIASFR